jgi:DNA mismatch repair protein MutS2
LEKAKQIAEKARQERQHLESTVANLKEEIYEQPSVLYKEAKKGNIAPGDFVRMKSGGATGTVESVDKNKAIVQIGQLRMTVNLRDLEHGREPLDVKSKVSIQSDTITQNAGFDPQLDIRGLKPEDALPRLEDFLDRALLTSSNHLRIVHGKGTGALRNTVRTKLREYREVKQAYHPAEEDGGDGVTLVEF